MRAGAPWTVIGVPIDSVGRAGGTEFAPHALRRAGLVGRLGAADAGDLDVRVRGEERDAQTGVVAAPDVLAMTLAVREAVRDTVSRGERPFLAGGCCALLPGALAGVRDAGSAIGLVHVDGHVDVYDGATSPTGEAADMPVGVALGREPALWTEAAGGASLVPGEVIVLGARDPEEADDIARLLEDELAEIDVVSDVALRTLGPARVAADAAARLATAPGRFWVHLDVDVLDEVEMPATDYLMPGGLDWAELSDLLGPLGASPALAGVSVGCVNPEKDPDGVCIPRTVDLLGRAFGQGARHERTEG
jgi:arginase